MRNSFAYNFRLYLRCGYSLFFVIINCIMDDKDIKQHIPFYKDNFKSDFHWLKKETEHYIFYYFSNSVAEKEIDTVAKRQENGFNKIMSFLKIKSPNEKINYYLYPSPEIKKELMGDDWYAQAVYHDFSIHILYMDKIKPIGEHEDTHLLSLPWGLSIGLFQEGLAEYLVGHNWYGVSHEESIKEVMGKNILPKIISIMSQKEWMNLPEKYILYHYCLAGSFVKFIINNFGRQKFETLYKKTNRKNSSEQNKKIFENIYGITVEKAGAMWEISLT